MSNHNDSIIKRPLITEKATWEGQARNSYAFVVDRLARKEQIRAAVQKIYGVRVVDVRTQVRKGEYKKTRYGEVKGSDWKKAIVQLHPDDKFELI